MVAVIYYTERTQRIFQQNIDISLIDVIIWTITADRNGNGYPRIHCEHHTNSEYKSCVNIINYHASKFHTCPSKTSSTTTSTKCQDARESVVKLFTRRVFCSSRICNGNRFRKQCHRKYLHIICSLFVSHNGCDVICIFMYYVCWN